MYATVEHMRCLTADVRRLQQKYSQMERTGRTRPVLDTLAQIANLAEQAVDRMVEERAWRRSNNSAA